MTMSELGSLGEVVGAFGLIVTLVFLAMEMRLARQAEESRDLEQVQIRVQELNLAVATSPSLSAIMAKWNELTGGHFHMTLLKAGFWRHLQRKKGPHL